MFSRLYLGDKPSMLDFHIWPWYERMSPFKEMGIDMLPEEKFPNMNKWVSRMLEIPAVKETMFDAKAHMHYYMTYSSGKPDYDYGL